jgi:hypothetical protein
MAAPNLNDLLKPFAPPAAQLLREAVSNETLSLAHLQEIARLAAQVPRYRAAEELESLLEDAEEMDLEAFRDYVAEIVREAKG